MVYYRHVSRVGIPHEPRSSVALHRLGSGIRLRDIAAELAITERTAYGIVTDLTDAGYVVKEKDGRRNRYEVQGHLPLRDAVAGDRTVGEVLGALVRPRKRRPPKRSSPRR